MALNIPLPQAPDVAFGQGLDRGLGMYQALQNARLMREKLGLAQQQEERAQELMPLQKQLMEAQAAQAQAKALQANMMAQLLGVDAGETVGTEQQQYPALQEMFQGQGMLRPEMMEQQATPQVQSGVSSDVIYPGNPQMYGLDKMTQVMNPQAIQSHYDSDGNLIRVYPSGKIERRKVSQSEQERERAKGFAAGDVKIANEMTESLPEDLNMMHIYNRLDNALNNPLWKEMQNNAVAKYGLDWGRKLSLDAFKNLGNKEQQDLIGRIKSDSKQIVAQTSKMFKGPFRVTEQDLVEDMKPRDTDPINVALGKLDEMRKLQEFQIMINTQVPKMIREQGMSAQEAFIEVMKNSGANKFVDNLKNKYSDKQQVKSKWAHLSLEELQRIASGQ